MSINRVEISGNLTRDCEVRTLPSGNAAIEFGVAVNDRRKNNATGEWEDVPNFVDCTVFSKSEKHERWLSNALLKGTKVAVAGRLRYSQWEKDGQRRSKLSVVVDEIEVMSGRAEGEGGAAETPQRISANTRKDPPRAPSAPAGDEYDEDSPV